MMQIIFVDPDNNIEWYEFDHNFDHIYEVISDNLHTLDAIAHECNVAALSDFIADYIEEDPYEFGLGGEWFAVKSGLQSLDAIIQYLRGPEKKGKSKAVARKARKVGEWVVDELQEMQGSLTFAANQSRSAHFKLVLFKIVEGSPVLARAPKLRFE